MVSLEGIIGFFALLKLALIAAGIIATLGVGFFILFIWCGIYSANYRRRYGPVRSLKRYR